MARVTVEDCVKSIPNRFELSLLAGRRTKDLLSGAPALINNKKDEKYTVTALREIGKGLINIETVKEELKNDMKGKKVINYENDKIKKLINTKVSEDLNEQSTEIEDDEYLEDEYFEDKDTEEDEELSDEQEEEEEEL
jgi:DNA-directed RNA polymerase subunit omega